MRRRRPAAARAGPGARLGGARDRPAFGRRAGAPRPGRGGGHVLQSPGPDRGGLARVGSATRSP